MTRAFLIATILLLTGPHARAVDPVVPIFDYELSVTSHSEWKIHYGISVEYKVLMFKGSSIEKIRGDATGHPVIMTVTSSENGIEVVTKEELALVGKPEYPPEKPLRGFQFRVESLQLQPDGKSSVILKFKDATEKYSLRYTEGKGLILEAVEAPHGKVIASTVPEFHNLKKQEGEILWQCNSLTVSATKNGKTHWSTDVPMQGLPESMSVLDKVLFVKTGKLLFYDASVMTGKNPADEIRAIWEKEMGMTFQQRNKRGYGRFIKAAVALEDKRSIPLLIECVEHGQGLEEKCAAVAALEKFNGNANAWPEPLPRDPGYFMQTIGMNRVFPAANRDAERKKWEAVYKDYLQK